MGKVRKYLDAEIAFLMTYGSGKVNTWSNPNANSPPFAQAMYAKWASYYDELIGHLSTITGYQDFPVFKEGMEGNIQVNPNGVGQNAALGQLVQQLDKEIAGTGDPDLKAQLTTLRELLEIEQETNLTLGKERDADW